MMEILLAYLAYGRELFPILLQIKNFYSVLQNQDCIRSIFMPSAAVKIFSLHMCSLSFPLLLLQAALLRLMGKMFRRGFAKNACMRG
ncbi:hypothetical protein [Candidatus Magnetaquicoccus inordinatus]|uniref:hypothetical protein n=1 Tax=Candidatus Magnetaquicoccus inordinatus TaxID=2496818 RepID=UPI00129215E5|nr:hypothetical protein [Candidatus Magnetaquicoccus inordinatus]